MDLRLERYNSDLRIRQGPNGKEVFDPVRKKYVAYSPEEFVRQLLIRYLQEEEGISYGRMMTERKVRVMGSDQRFDLAVYDREGRIVLLAECKSFRLPLGEEAVLQAFRYNTTIDAQCILVTNGRSTFCYAKDPGTNRWLHSDLIPSL